jgi:uncharacterized protein (TIGR00730 family)
MEAHYRVVIFGSARIKEGDPLYDDVYFLARELALFGFDIVTGGGPGLMQAASAGHKSVKSDTLSIGLNIKLPRRQPTSKYLDIKKDFDRFSSRLDTFMSLSDAVIVAPGGIGTLLELFYSWQLVQVHEVCETPIILYGELWTPLVEWLRNEVLKRGLFDPQDMHHIFHLTSVEKVLRLIKKIHQDRLGMDHVCENYNKYRVELEEIQK